MKARGSALALLGALFLLALPALAAPGERAGAVAAPIPWVLVLDRNAPVSALDDDPLAFLKRVALADSCQGGSCQTGLGGVLSCPSLGGPSCNSNQPCACLCVNMPNGSWSSLNHCMSAD